tara:strand:- start:38 stop:253 length:216 start_codon:yes stop_codon:yes gene_type:complete
MYCRVTLTNLALLGRLKELPQHIDLARTDGINNREFKETLTHLAFYVLWLAADSVIKRVSNAISLDRVFSK